MNPTHAAMLGAALGLLVSALAVWFVVLSERRERAEAEAATRAAATVLPAGAGDVLAVLRSGGIVLDASDAVVKASPSAVSHGLVRGRDLVHPQLLDIARRVRRDGVIREDEMDLPRGPMGQGRITVGVRVAPLGDHFVLLLVDDRTAARRVEEIRRDFTVNVSHELKTPVGGLALLAEAVDDAADDPEAVRRFARRMRIETERLTLLVKEIVELSRLQVQDSLGDPVRLEIADAVATAVDQVRLVAGGKDIAVTTVGLDTAGPGGEPVCVYGDEELLTTAVRNLLTNAISYSEPGTHVTVMVSADGAVVELAVTDQGMGISLEDQARVFERFYRADPARSRQTGGTGLGLAIVKHVAQNHGGEVTLWSRPGEGSTFTIRLPQAPPEEDHPRRYAADEVRDRPGDGAGEGGARR